ncbi:DUF397 domain-containing protein [Streptomyces sp. NPDC001941]|uniref:DUF397 domain-containing protein n=1 Tax=Streptomyces sp. NPDC001941 TaxID=3154659 RepID=UPI00331E6567
MIYPPDTTKSLWRKSSYSSSTGECVEFTPIAAALGVILIRDSKAPEGPILAPTPASWTTFINGLKY